MLVETSRTVRIVDPAEHREVGQVAVGAGDALFALGPGAETVATADRLGTRQVMLYRRGKAALPPIPVPAPSPARDLQFLRDGRSG